VKPYEFHLEATAELTEAADYYEARLPGLGGELIAEVDRAIEQIRRTQGAGASHGKYGMRRRVLQRFPYVIFYRDLPDFIWIAAVAHGKRRPGYWRHRAPAEEDL
jgi:toxin ParE1/3/4